MWRDGGNLAIFFTYFYFFLVILPGVRSSRQQRGLYIAVQCPIFLWRVPIQQLPRSTSSRFSAFQHTEIAIQPWPGRFIKIYYLKTTFDEQNYY